ncbi:MAG TPA: phosphonate ABC transporter, permease protein PhnE [bacterium]|nr:phosphonate ABC transporter, permease protein PhnE [bacterium]
MSTHAASAAPNGVLERAPKRPDLRLQYTLALAAVLVLFTWSYQAVHFDPVRLWSNRRNMADYILRGMPPTGIPSIAIVDRRTAGPLLPPVPPPPAAYTEEMQRTYYYDYGRWAWSMPLSENRELRVRGMNGKDLKFLREVFFATVKTIQLALIGTVFAALLTLPLTFAAARNTAPPWLVGMTRFLFNADRSIDALIVAIIFVTAVGPGEFAGTLAIIIHSIGNLGKMFAEAVEEIDQGQVEALQAVGARGPEIVRWAILPQVLPLWISYFLFRFELNVRMSVVLGLVGAGGIGALLNQWKGVDNEKMFAIVLVIMVLVMVIDGLSSKLRSYVL